MVFSPSAFWIILLTETRKKNSCLKNHKDTTQRNVYRKPKKSHFFFKFGIVFLRRIAVEKETYRVLFCSQFCWTLKHTSLFTSEIATSLCRCQLLKFSHSFDFALSVPSLWIQPKNKTTSPKRFFSDQKQRRDFFCSPQKIVFNLPTRRPVCQLITPPKPLFKQNFTKLSILSSWFSYFLKLLFPATHIYKFSWNEFFLLFVPQPQFFSAFN